LYTCRITTEQVLLLHWPPVPESLQVQRQWLEPLLPVPLELLPVLQLA
jgi:hypothetical protein